MHGKTLDLRRRLLLGGALATVAEGFAAGAGFGHLHDDDGRP